MTTLEQRRAALELANEKRLRIADLRRRIRTEHGALEDVLLNPPEELAGIPIIDIVRYAYDNRPAKTAERLGRLAIRDGVNLLMPLGRASARTREWTAEHTVWHRSAAWSRLGVRS